MFEILRETCKSFLIGCGVCCCLQTCNSVLCVEVMGLVLGQSLMVISTTGTLHFCCLHVKYTVYKHFGRSLHIGSLDPT